jgi:hypothetical protein
MSQESEVSGWIKFTDARPAVGQAIDLVHDGFLLLDFGVISAVEDNGSAGLRFRTTSGSDWLVSAGDCWRPTQPRRTEL